MIHNQVFQQLPSQYLSAVHDDICSGDILLCSGTGLVSELIKKSTGSIFSHVALILQLPVTRQWLVLESVESVGVRCVTLKEGYLTNYMDQGKGYPGNILIARHALMQKNAFNLPLLYQTAFSLTGDKYSREDIFHIATRIALNKIGIHENGLIKENNRYICSEYLYACYKSIGIDLPYDPLGFIAPETIAALPEVAPIAHLITADIVLPAPADTVSENKTSLTEHVI